MYVSLWWGSPIFKQAKQLQIISCKRGYYSDEVLGNIRTDILSTHSAQSNRSFAGVYFCTFQSFDEIHPSDIDPLARIKSVDGPLTESKWIQYERVVL